MRFRTILLILLILLVAAFVALNMDEFTRVSVLSLGFTTVQVALGMVMLMLFVVSLLVFLASNLYMQSRHLLEARAHTRELDSQRLLADKAEASRFTELRTYIEEQARMANLRESEFATELAGRFASQQQQLIARMEQTDNTLAAYLGQIEDRLERRGLLAGNTGQASDGVPLVTAPGAFSGPRV